ncbi:MAG: EF-P beta-lysylation protein EpmB [Halioglobus sp.]|nr:EF-P beta-lysylation protein EpmB [Halioglobus sp.]
MQPSNLIAQSSHDWQSQLRDVVTSRRELLKLLKLSESDVGFSEGACQDFALKVPRSFVRRMQPQNPYDPLLLQVLSSAQEMINVPEYHGDPVGENAGPIPQRGIIHKYHGRVLLIVSSGCAVNCRYCFRRHFPYGDNQNSRRQWTEALKYIHSNDNIEEVIFSGGDPLVATDGLLQQLVAEIASIGHVTRLRIHSRLPIVIPERVTQQLLDAITHPRLQTLMVTHCNHAHEIDDAVTAALATLRGHNIITLNQAVLLKNINDSVAAQVALNRALFAAGTLPYYLHMLDKVQGAAHFDVTETHALQIMEEVAARLPGYMVPKLVREVAGADAKIIVNPSI